ncbi:MAG TPA: hypothetical protein DDX39_01740 [Bacteroidales bacterium]|nr:MAG: hypothetical protein A2W98_07955 [Bacteroidetes bacterium GWF2_33_38]OFY88337.1 MAG: hypothetical protein A2236_01010 [Bacteroidetes bacterium RIFOXYA2_FULL_33_7]HBF87334.1 hypothetical protein [Bacteroidales bacterium]
MKKIALFIAASMMVVWSCNQTPSDQSTVGTEVEDSLQGGSVDRNTQYRLPSPVEFYMFLREAKAPFNAKELNNVDNISKYITLSSKAINFGVYASDLGYCTVFGQNQETFLYFKQAKQIADELGLTEGFDEQLAGRIDQNINNSDSLYQITSDGYWEAVSFLESNDKSNLLPYILFGSWVESVHLAIKSVKKFDANDPIVIRITEQQLLLENLIDYLNSLNDNSQLQDIISKLTDLQSSFDLLYENPEDVIITQEQYKEITEKVELLRSEIIS